MRSRESESQDGLNPGILSEDDYNELDGEDLEGFSIKEEGDEFGDELGDNEDDLLDDDDLKDQREEEEEMF